MVLLGFILPNKNLRCVKTRRLNEPLILLLGILLGKNSQETHLYAQGKKLKNALWNATWNNTNKNGNSFDVHQWGKG